MKILIVCGIFEPESGGPAPYAARLAARLHEAGDEVHVVTFSDSAAYPRDAAYLFRLTRVVRGNKLLNRVRMLRAVWSAARAADVLLFMDWFAAGFPAAIAARLLKKPYVVRIGGEYLWEQWYFSGSEGPVTLREFYERGLHRRPAYALYRSMMRYVVSGACYIVFNSEGQRELYERHYGLTNTRTIPNPIPRAESTSVVRCASTHELVYWGRFVRIKNIDTLVRAFAMARIPSDYTLLLVGDGPDKPRIERLVSELGLQERVRMLPGMPQREALERVKDARAFVLPSWTDISPNQVYEALAIGLPALVTKENFLSIRDQLPLMIDPRSAEGIARTLELLVGDREYAAFVQAFRSISFEWSWDDAVREYRTLFESIL